MILLGTCSDEEVSSALLANPELADRLRTAMPKSKAPPPQVLAELKWQQHLQRLGPLSHRKAWSFRPHCQLHSSCSLGSFQRSGIFPTPHSQSG